MPTPRDPRIELEAALGRLLKLTSPDHVAFVHPDKIRDSWDADRSHFGNDADDFLDKVLRPRLTVSRQRWPVDELTERLAALLREFPKQVGVVAEFADELINADEHVTPPAIRPPNNPLWTPRTPRHWGTRRREDVARAEIDFGRALEKLLSAIAPPVAGSTQGSLF